MDPIPEVRSVAARAIGSLIGGMGEENFPDLVPWLFETLKSDNSNVERSGAAQGLSEVSPPPPRGLKFYFLANCKFVLFHFVSIMNQFSQKLRTLMGSIIRYPNVF